MEQWKSLRINPVFQVSNYGNVRRNLNISFHEIEKIGLCGYLKKYNRPISTKHSSGNEIIQGVLTKANNGIDVAVRVDKIVYQYFIGDANFDNYKIVHVDSDKQNCHYKNLSLEIKQQYLKRLSLTSKRWVKRRLMNEDLKRCSKCNEYKLIHEFKYHSFYERYRSQCITCGNRSALKRIKKYTESNKLAVNFRARTTQAFVSKGYKKNSTTEKILGCSWEELKIHIEEQFTEGMTWDNYGDWHVDHIIPISMADTEEQLYKLSHYTNLQPLWGLENISKNNKLPREQIKKAKEMGLNIDYSKII